MGENRSRTNYRGKHYNSKHRKKLLRRRRMLVACMLLIFAVLTGGTLFVVNQVKTNGSIQASKQQNENAAAVKTDNLKLDVSNADSDVAAKTELLDKAGTAPDRSNFAVDPNVPVGSDTSTTEKVVYMTFDDGPSYNTQKVLDILDKYDAKATFFVVGLNADYYNMIKVAYDKGHTIGLHTFSHDYAAVYASQDAYFNDLAQIGEVVKQQIGYVPCFIRFPGGSSNTISANYTQGIMTALAQEVQTRGYQYYDWNISCGDGGVNPADALVAQATSVNYDNIVLLMHDANNKETTVEALPRIIEHYKSLGYQFKAIDRATFDAHHGIGN